ncbi:unnamed protein product, partial [Adineta steineri]
MSDDDDIPPLEDIPINTVPTKPTATPVVKYVEAPSNEKPAIDKSYAGMKKGFLNSSSTSKSKSNELIEVIRKKPEQTKDFRVLDEVQQVIKEEQQSKNSWLTNDLLKQIEGDESLAKHFSNPYFMEAINLFQQKPEEALKKYGHNAELIMSDDDDIPPLEDIPINTVPTTKPTATPIVKYVEAPSNEQPAIDKSYAGMKKGFLNSSSTSKSKSNELIEVIRKKPEQTKDFRVLDEVQQVIKEEQQSKNSWLTNDLLKQIEGDESLAKNFSNPYFMEAINLFQQKPEEALKKYGHNAE